MPADPSTERSMSSAKQVPFVFGPLAIVGLVLTISIWFAPIGLPVFALSVAMLRMAATARRNNGVWSRGVRPAIVALALITLGASVLALAASVAERFDFASDGSAPGLLVLLVWTLFITTMCVSLFRHGVLQPRKPRRQSVVGALYADVRTVISARSPQWHTAVLGSVGMVAVTASLLTVPAFVEKAGHDEVHAAEILARAAVPGLVVALVYTWLLTPSWKFRWRVLLTVSLTLGLSTVRLISWAAHFEDNSLRSIPVFVTLPLLLVVLTLPLLYRRRGRWTPAAAGAVLSIHLVAVLFIGFDASRCEDDDCIPADITFQLAGIGLYWASVASLDHQDPIRRFFHGTPTRSLTQ